MEAPLEAVPHCMGYIRSRVWLWEWSLGTSGCKTQTCRWVCFVFLNLLTVLAEALQPRNSVEDIVSLVPTNSQPHLTPQLECEWGDAFSVPLRGRETQGWKTLEAF